jgi:hypothetical protein
MNQMSRPVDALHVRHRVSPLRGDARVHTSGGSVMCVSVSIARNRSKRRFVMVFPPIRQSSAARRAASAGAELAAQTLGELLDVECGGAGGRSAGPSASAA